MFEESRKKNPDLKMPTEPPKGADLTPEDLALIKQGVGDKTARPHSAEQGGEASEEAADQIGSIVTYFEEKGFGFLRPETGGRDVFFHISRLTEGSASDLAPGSKILFEVGMDRTGKTAATSLRVPPPPEPPPVA